MIETKPVNGALACAKRGWYVFPLPVNAKSPPPEGYQIKSTRDPARIRLWERRRPGRNYGIAPALSGLIFLDVDTRDGKRGAQTLADLEMLHGELPPTFTVRTPSGGTHFYFEGPHLFKLSILRKESGLDSPQYVVAPGSTFNGGRYTVTRNLPVAPMPNWLPEVIGEDDRDDVDQVPVVDLDLPGNVAWAIHHLKYDAQPSIEGRNGEYTLLMTAAALKDRGISKHHAIGLLAEHYNVAGRCDPLWLIGDGPVADCLDIKVENAWRYLTKVRPGARTAEADFADDQPPSDVELAELAAWWKKFDASPTQRQKAISRARWARARRLVTIPDKDRQPQRPVS